MTKRRSQPPMPATPFAFLIVEGGDEVGLCETLLASTAPARPIVIWKADGRGVDVLAGLAALEASLVYATHRAVLLDAEEDPVASLELARTALARLNIGSAALAHGQMSQGDPRGGFFLLPDGTRKGANERLLREAAANSALARCADQFETCVGITSATSANCDKSWVQAYLAASPKGGIRAHDAVGDPACFATSGPVFDPLRTFLRGLVE